LKVLDGFEWIWIGFGWILMDLVGFGWIWKGKSLKKHWFYKEKLIFVKAVINKNIVFYSKT